MKRPVFSFRPNMDQDDHRAAWEILSHVPEGRKNQYLVKAILHEKECGHMEQIIRKVIKEEMEGLPLRVVQEAEEKEQLPAQALYFISMLQDE